jgi:hypothetical protein
MLYSLKYYLKIYFKTHTSEAISGHLQGILNCEQTSCNLHDEPEQHMMPTEQMSQEGNISHQTKWSSSPENEVGEISFVIKPTLK